jgi:hypothetical protein
METNLTTKLDAAIAYLRSRNIYVVDAGNKFVPTPPANTDVAATMRRYEIQVLGLNNVKKARR